MTHAQDTAERKGTEVIDFRDLICSLPKWRDTRNPVWRRTQIAPCAILSQCVECKQYLPITSFYIYKNKACARRDILGQKIGSNCKTCAVKKYTEVDPRLKLLYAARSRAKLKGFEFDLTIDDIVIPEYCPVLGVKLKPNIGIGKKGASVKYCSPTIDRLDNTKGYTKENIKVISYRANMLKLDATISEMKAVLKYMEDNLHTKRRPA